MSETKHSIRQDVSCISLHLLHQSVVGDGGPQSTGDRGHRQRSIIAYIIHITLLLVDGSQYS
jgi:hypothetical protein